MLGDDVQSKMHYGHYTFYAKSMVTNTKNVALLKNIFCNDYRGGFNTEFFTWETGVYNKNEIVYTELNRPSIFADDGPARHKSQTKPV